MRRSLIALSALLLVAGCTSRLPKHFPTIPVLGQAEAQHRADQDACRGAAAAEKAASSIGGRYVACMLARGYATRIKTWAGSGLVSVVVTPAAAQPEAQAAEDLTACYTALVDWSQMPPDEKATVLKIKAGELGTAFVPFAGTAIYKIPAPDSAYERYIGCWTARGFQAVEHKKDDAGEP